MYWSEKPEMPDRYWPIPQIRIWCNDSISVSKTDSLGLNPSVRAPLLSTLPSVLTKLFIY